MRLAHDLEAARELMRHRGHGRLVSEQRRAAIRAVRTLDRWHLRRIRRNPRGVRVPLANPRDGPPSRAIAKRFGRCSRDRGRCASRVDTWRFSWPGCGCSTSRAMVGDRPVIAWSAGAMAMSDRIVLFHDHPPQGAGDPEVLDAGLALCRQVVALPHARRRLQLDDPIRVSLFARPVRPSHLRGARRRATPRVGREDLVRRARNLPAGTARRRSADGERLRRRCSPFKS